MLKDFLKNQLVSELDENDDIANWEKVLKAMNLLREEEKKLIDLYYLQGYKDREIYENEFIALCFSGVREKSTTQSYEKIN
jgi:DNA-directed RNA polymerase specialized sigma subunit